ncbi:MAG: hypothetical protein UHY90_03285 [Treponema sp.]|nr:hypothetical protein [Spirochaetia bacterium]MEE1181252.1 hypothetical protein [Treponema sp.]
MNLRIRKFILISFSVLTLPCFAKKQTRPMKYNNISEKATILYENANAEIASSKYILADSHLEEAFVQAVSVDNKELLCKISLSKAILCYYTGTDYSNDLNEARHFAETSGQKDFLLSLCTLYEADIKGADADFEKVNATEKNVSKNPYYLALLYRIKGNCYAQKMNYNSAILFYTKAAELHTKECYLAEIGLDWYQAARMYSLNGDKANALKALDSALKYDRDAENTTAIGSDYFAKALVLTKGNYIEAEKAQAKENAQWAKEIFTAGGYTNMAERCVQLLKTIDK